MSILQHIQPTKIKLGTGIIETLGEIACTYGKRCLLVTAAPEPVLLPLFERAQQILQGAQLEVTLFQNVRPNPLVSGIDEGIALAHKVQAEMVIALGGGSVIDTAKVIAYCARTGEADWSDLLGMRADFREQKTFREEVLPLIAIPTTSGTGSQCTQAAVISDNITNEKTTVFRQEFFPKEALIDPELMMTLPPGLTASTGFDAFCHLSESYINGTYSPIAQAMAIKGMELVAEALPALKEKNDIAYRTMMSWADTMGGICLSNGGATFPHFLGEILTGIVPVINHGCSLALVYPAYIEEFFEDEQAGPAIRKILALINTGNLPMTNALEARRIMECFLDRIGLRLKFSQYQATTEQKEKIYKAVSEQKRFKQTGCIRKVLDNFMTE